MVKVVQWHFLVTVLLTGQVLNSANGLVTQFFGEILCVGYQATVNLRTPIQAQAIQEKK